MIIQLSPDEVARIVKERFPTATDVSFFEVYLDGSGRGATMWNYAEVTLPLFEPIPAAKTKANPLTEPFETPLTDEEVATVLTGVMRSKEPRKFLGVDVDLPAPLECFESPYIAPPAPCQYCSGSVINHAPGCVNAPYTTVQDEKPIVPACMLQEDCCLERGHSGKCMDVPF